MFQTKWFFAGITTCLLILTFSVMNYRAISNTSEINSISTRAAAITQNDKKIEDYCGYNPNDEIFKKGDEVIPPPKLSAAMDKWIILLPNVKQQKTEYKQIRFRPNDTVTVNACGCVQTGGKGQTWKSYVDPVETPKFPEFGYKPTSLYHGLMRISDFQGSSSIPGFVRIRDLMYQQNRNNFQLHISENSYLVLGYEDDDYSDNGYHDHDNGNENQCQFTGGAAVEIIIKHDISKIITNKNADSKDKIIKQKPNNSNN